MAHAIYDIRPCLNALPCLSVDGRLDQSSRTRGAIHVNAWKRFLCLNPLAMHLWMMDLIGRKGTMGVKIRMHDSFISRMNLGINACLAVEEHVYISSRG